MRRLFKPEEIENHLQTCYSYVADEFGDEYCIPVSRLRLYRERGVHLYQPYGDFSNSPPKVLGLVNCILISHGELSALKDGTRREIELEPWSPADGNAVLWVASVVSDVPGVAAKCMSGIMDQLDSHPHKDRIDRIAVFCTGPQGYLMSEAFGLNEAGFYYQEGWPFMERMIEPRHLAEIGSGLQTVWNMTKARDVVGRGIERWGPGWKRQIYARTKK